MSFSVEINFITANEYILQIIICSRLFISFDHENEATIAIEHANCWIISHCFNSFFLARSHCLFSCFCCCLCVSFFLSFFFRITSLTISICFMLMNTTKFEILNKNALIFVMNNHDDSILSMTISLFLQQKPSLISNTSNQHSIYENVKTENIIYCSNGFAWECSMNMLSAHTHVHFLDSFYFNDTTWLTLTSM